MDERGDHLLPQMAVINMLTLRMEGPLGARAASYTHTASGMRSRSYTATLVGNPNITPSCNRSKDSPSALVDDRLVGRQLNLLQLGPLDVSHHMCLPPFVFFL